MKTIKLCSVFLLMALCASWTHPNSETFVLNDSEKKLSILLKGYKKMTKTKILSPKEVIAFSKKKGITSKKLKVTQVAAIQYATKGKKIRTVYALEVNGDLNFFAFANQFSSVVNYDDSEGDGDGDGDGTGGGEDPDCEVLTENCGGEDCSCYCVVYNTCDPDEIESDPDCCSDCSCDEDEFADGFDDFMETLAA